MPGTADSPAPNNNGFFGHLSFQKTPSDLATPTLLKRRSKGRVPGTGASTTTSASRRKSTPLAHTGVSHDRTPVRARAAAQSQADEDAGWFRLPPAQRDPPGNTASTRQVPLHAEEQERSEEQVARSALLAEFGELCAHFPIELYRSLRFIRSCDDAAMGHARALDRSCRQLQASRNLADSLGLRQEIARHMQRARADRAEACAEVAKLQQLVEVHRLMLKAEREKIEKPAESLAATDLKSAAEQARLAEATATAVASTVADTSNTAVVEDKKMDSKKRKHQGKRKSLVIKSPKRTRDKTPVADMDEDEDMNDANRQAAAGEQEVIFDIPIDEDEPVYCYCNRVSFGKMLACENEACEGGEWFHFPCLGITSAPKGKWFCETCLKQAGRQGRGRAETAQERRMRLKRERREQEVKRRARQSGRR